MIKLSIIIPYYNTEKYTDELLAVLEKQVTKECEIILVDDGSKKEYCPWQMMDNMIILRHLSNRGVSAARNTGLKKAKGEYIAFIDSDDMVTEDYVEQILLAIESEPDTVYLSWRSMDGKFGKTIRNMKDEFGPYNRCVWNRVFKKEYIRGMKFDEKMPVAEDDDFLKRLPKAESHTFVSKPIYLYRVGRQDGLSVRKARGEFDEPDIITQVVFYYNWIQEIGGVETFFYNFCRKMAKYYDICIIYDRYAVKQLARLQRVAQCVKNGMYRIQCDTLIINGIFDNLPQKVTAKKTIRLVHTCKIPSYGINTVPDDCDKKIFVSKASMESFSETGDVINNLPGEMSGEKALILISATRLTDEKGYNRMIKLADRFRKLNIPFLWLVFTAHNDRKFPEGFVKLEPTLNIEPFLAKCDYVVQLSDVEAFCYTIQEALQLKKPVLTTPIKVLPEVGFREGENGWIIPFDIEKMSDEEVKGIYDNIPICEQFDDKSEEIIKKWRKVLGNTKPKHTYVYDDTQKTIMCTCSKFRDVVLDKVFHTGDVQTVDQERARALVAQGYWKYV